MSIKYELLKKLVVAVDLKSDEKSKGEVNHAV